MKRVWWLYAGAGCLLLAGYPLVPQLWQQVCYDLISASVVPALLFGVRRHRPASRLPWYLFTAGQACYTVADVAWNFVNSRYGSVPTPSVIDAAYLAYYPLVAVGLWVLVRRRNRSAAGSGVVLDALVAVSAVGMVVWLLVRPSVVDSGGSVAASLVNLAYPLGDLGLLVLTLRLALGAGRRSGALRLLVLSLVLTTAADLALLALSAQTSFDGGSATDLLWLSGYLAFGAAGLHPSMRGLGEPGPTAPARLGRGRVVLLGAAMLVGPVAPAASALGEHSVDLVAFMAGSAVLYLLVLARIVGVVRQHERSLHREQDLRARSRSSERRFRAIVEASSDIVTVSDADGMITWCAPSIQRLTGYLPADLIGRSPREFVHPDDAATVDYLAEAITTRGTSAHADCRLRMRDGTYRVFQVTAQNLLADPDVAGVVLTGLDVTERRQLADELHRRAFCDELTGLANRALFADRLQHALLRRSSPAGDVAVLFVDLDDFKTINDSLGHQAGDDLLVQVARRLPAALRPADTTARLGGDEFAVLLEETDEAYAAQVAGRILTELANPYRVDGRDVFIGASIGLTTGRHGGDEPEVLLRNADIAMYQAKQSGKNQHAVYRPSMHAAAVARLELQADLQRALERGEFVVYYQPVTDLRTGRLVSVEALLRWHHPQRGLVNPAEFVPLAEESGLIEPLGRWVLHEACRQLRDWQRRFPARFNVAVNVSVRQLAAAGFTGDVADALRQTGLDAGYLILELTETAFMADVDAAEGKLAALRDLGTRIAIDDFGTGYSSLSYLDRYPIDMIKIDRSFVAALPHPTGEPTLIQIMLDLARRLDLPIVAEGIENAEQLNTLRRLGCALGQGVLLATPRPTEDISAMLAASRYLHLDPTMPTVAAA